MVGRRDVFYLLLNQQDKDFLNNKIDDIFYGLSFKINNKYPAVTYEIFVTLLSDIILKSMDDFLYTLSDEERRFLKCWWGLHEGVSPTREGLMEKLDMDEDEFAYIRSRTDRKLRFSSFIKTKGIFLEDLSYEFSSSMNYSHYFEEMIRKEIQVFLNTRNCTGMLSQALINRYNNVSIASLNLDDRVVGELELKGYHYVYDLNSEEFCRDKTVSGEEKNIIKEVVNDYLNNSMAVMTIIEQFDSNARNLITRQNLTPIQIVYWLSKGCLFVNDWFSVLCEDIKTKNGFASNKTVYNELFNLMMSDKDLMGLDYLLALTNSVCITLVSRRLQGEMEKNKIKSISRLRNNVDVFSEESKIEIKHILYQVDSAEELLNKNNKKLKLDKKLLNLCHADIYSGKENVFDELTIEDLGLSTRVVKALKMANINTVEQLSTFSVSRLRKVRRLGNKSVEDILVSLSKHDINLRP